jgi:hypothetical protein
MRESARTRELYESAVAYGHHTAIAMAPIRREDEPLHLMLLETLRLRLLQLAAHATARDEEARNEAARDEEARNEEARDEEAGEQDGEDSEVDTRLSHRDAFRQSLRRYANTLHQNITQIHAQFDTRQSQLRTLLRQHDNPDTPGGLASIAYDRIFTGAPCAIENLTRVREVVTRVAREAVGLPS